MEKNTINKPTYKQKAFAQAIAKELGLSDFDIKNYDTKEKIWDFIKKNVDEFHRLKTERAKKENPDSNNSNGLPF